MRAWLIWVLVMPAVLGAELTQEERAVNEEGLGTLRAMLSNPEAGYSDGQREILETQAAVIEARLRGSDADELRLMEHLYLLSREEYGVTGESTLWSALNVDFSTMPFALLSLCQRAEGMSRAERVAAADRISRYEPEDMELQDVVVGILLEAKSHAEVAPYCTERIEAGHDYYRCVRAAMRVGSQRELIEKALRENGANVYDPSVAEHAQAALAFEEAWNDPTPKPSRLVAYCDVLLDAYAVTLSGEEAVLEYMDEALARMGDWPDRDEVEWAVDELGMRRALLVDTPPESAVWAERRSLAAYGAGKWKTEERPRPRLTEEAGTVAAKPREAAEGVPKPSGAVTPPGAETPKAATPGATEKAGSGVPGSTPRPAAVIEADKTDEQDGQETKAAPAEPVKQADAPVSADAPVQGVTLPAAATRSFDVLPVLIGCVVVGALLLVVLCVIWWVQRKKQAG